MKSQIQQWIGGNMSGKIFALNEGGALIGLEQEKYKDEDFFQSLIEKYPEILAGDQINPDNPRDWILISREMGVPAEQGGGSQWYLDHLFIDQDAVPTLVEVKRSSDTRIRREVVAQMLDYAANAVQYWTVESVQAAYEENLQNGGKSLSDIGITPENENNFWQSVDSNLRLGKLRLIFVSDEIPASLQTIIEFLNNQMTNTEVLGLEIKQFRSTGGFATLVPRLIGRTTSAVQTKRESRKWDERSFFERVTQLDGNEVAAVCEELLRDFEKFGCHIWWSEGKIAGGFVPIYIGKQRHQLCNIYAYFKHTRIELYFQHMKPPLDTMEHRLNLKNNLERISGLEIPQDRITKRPSFEVGLLKSDESFGLFMDSMKSYIDEIRKVEGME
jgi:hypothetical protein